MHYYHCVSPSVHPICFPHIPSDTGHWLIYIHHWSCTLQSVDCNLHIHFVTVTYYCSIALQMEHSFMFIKILNESNFTLRVCMGIHLRNLLTHTLLFWHFLKNWNFELKNIFEYFQTMFSGNAWLFSEKSD